MFSTMITWPVQGGESTSLMTRNKARNKGGGGGGCVELTERHEQATNNIEITF